MRFVTFQAVESYADARAAPLRSDRPGTHLERRLMTHVLGVTTFQVGNPIADLVPMKTDNLPLQRKTWTRIAFQVAVRMARALRSR